MAIADQKSPSDNNNNKVWGFFKLPFRGSNSNTTPSSSSSTHLHNHNNPQIEGSNAHASNSVSSVARSLLPTRRRLKLDPAAKLYFPCKYFFSKDFISFFCVIYFAITAIYFRCSLWSQLCQIISFVLLKISPDWSASVGELHFLVDCW